MNITDNAKALLQAALQQENADGIRLRTKRSCCGTSLQFELVTIPQGEPAETINSLAVLMDEETRAWTQTIVADAQGGRLTLYDSAAACCCG